MPQNDPPPAPAKTGFHLFPLLILPLTLAWVGCSSVHILKPADGAVFSFGEAIRFEGKITRSMETGGADRSDDLSWESSINGHLGRGRSITVHTLTRGAHSISASWPEGGRSDRIFIRVKP